MPKSEQNVLTHLTPSLNRLKFQNIPHFLEGDASEILAIGESLKNNPSKNGGTGGGRPDITLVFTYENETYIVIIENKTGFANMLKADENGLINNTTKNGAVSYNNIKKFALNGAYYYAKNAYNDTSYKNYLIIGCCGEADSAGNYSVKINLMVMTAETLGAAVKIPNFCEFTDLSFLYTENLRETIKQIKNAALSEEERTALHNISYDAIDKNLIELNQKMRDDYGIDAKWRINMVVAMILAGLGDSDKDIVPLKAANLNGSQEDGETDADKIINKVRNLLKSRNLPAAKIDQIQREFLRTLKDNTDFNTRRSNSAHTVNRELYENIVNKILPFVENKLLDFAGIVYNKVSDWMGLADDEKNDVVLTPRYVVDFMVRLAGVNRNSYVWDFALGSGSFLISAMHTMLTDARENAQNLPEGLYAKERRIKEHQLLGIEKRSDIQMLAILNMLLVGDGSSQILNTDSLTNFNGSVESGKKGKSEKFPADVFLLNPPYSAEGNGMIFVKTALAMMSKGRAAVIIQDSAGSGRAAELNKQILQNNRLLASIKMPIDIFSGKSSVQVSIYVFAVAEPHNANHLVQFIDFRNDGYERSNRKKSGQDVNLRNTDRAKERYDEIVDVVLYGRHKLDIFTENEYIEDTINPTAGNDWNFEQHQKINTKPTHEDFRKTVGDYLAWEVAQILKTSKEDKEEGLGKISPSSNPPVAWGEFLVGELFEKSNVKFKGNYSFKEIKRGNLSKEPTSEFNLPLVNAKKGDNGIMYYGRMSDFEYEENVIAIIADGAVSTGDVHAQPRKIGVLYNAYLIKPLFEVNRSSLMFVAKCIEKSIKTRYGYENKATWDKVKTEKIQLPTTTDGSPDFAYMEAYTKEIETAYIRQISAYLAALNPLGGGGYL
ncbi:MAG: SAM-dependent methyltransferase, partial [Defluviitaleaceae bacterium]|nr:SAM-dependent methyltransferase [Defluviitaleaceae bacterium]